MVALKLRTDGSTGAGILKETLGDAIMSYNMEEDGPFEIYAFGKILAALEEVSIHFAPQQVYDL